MSSQTYPSGVKNSNIPVRIIAFSKNRRLRRECCLNVVLGHPGAPKRWRISPQEHPEGGQESPKTHRRATKSTRSEAKRAPKTTQKEAKRAIESSKAKCVKKTYLSPTRNRAPAEARVRFSMPEKRRQGNLPREGAVDPLCKEKSLRFWVRSDMLQILYAARRPADPVNPCPCFILRRILPRASYLEISFRAPFGALRLSARLIGGG